MNQPLGRVLRLRYRDVQPKVAADTSVLEVDIRTHEDEIISQPLDNPQWMVHNQALQFMAVYDIKPTDIDGTSMDVEDWQWLVPLGTDGDGGWGLAAHIFEDAASTLRSKDWFDAGDDTKDDDNGPGPHGGGGPDPGTGNRGGVDHDAEDERDVSAELAGDDSNAGVTVNIS